MNVDLGTVKKGSSLSKEFTLPKTIKQSKVGCASCTKTTFNENNLTITYKAVDSKGTWNKSVTVTFEDDTTEKIIFTVKVV